MLTTAAVSPPPAEAAARESLRLKKAGLAGMAAGFACMLGGEAVTLERLMVLEPTTAAIAVLWLTGAHVGAAGIIMLLAGFAGVPLLSNGRSGRGAARKMAGASILILTTGAALLGADRYAGDEHALGAMDALWLLLPVATRAGVLLVRSGWKYDPPAAEAVLARDPRPPIVYLRSFQDDGQLLIAGSRWQMIYHLFFNYLAGVGPEQELALTLQRIGPVVAIGKPGERLPELGAARLYAGDDEWRGVVEDLLHRARLVVLKVGATANLWWEAERAAALVPRQRLLFVTIGEVSESVRQRFAALFGTPQATAGLDLRTPAWQRLLRHRARLPGSVIWFDQQGVPREVPITGAVTWTGLLTVYVRPYRDPLRKALRTVLTALGIPWTEPRSQAAAVFLALFGGLFGLHHFYLGERRRGLLYVALFWLAVPLFLGWRDGVRLALIDARTFEGRYGARAGGQAAGSAHPAPLSSARP